MVASISEQNWSINFKEILTNHNLFIRRIRYVDNRLILGDRRLCDLPPCELHLDERFYGKPIVLSTEPDQEFLGFMLETNPFELIYCGPTNVSQGSCSVVFALGTTSSSRMPFPSTVSTKGLSN